MLNQRNAPQKYSAYDTRTDEIRGNDRLARHTPGGSSPVRYPGTCTLVIGSMTQTIRTQEALAAASIRSSVTKISSSRTHKGCSYGLYFPCAQTPNVRQVLDEAGISVRQILGEV